MYRAAPSYLLSQGDLLIVPRFEVEENPDLLALEKHVLERPPCVDCGVAQPQESKKDWTREKAERRVPRGEVPETARHVVAQIEPAVGLLLTHSCDVDAGAPLRFALVKPAKDLSKNYLAKLEGADPPKKYLLLPEIGGRMQRAVAHLEVQFTLASSLFGKGVSFVSKKKEKMERALVPFEEITTARIGSLDRALVEALYKNLMGLMSRSKTDLTMDFDPTLFEDDADRPHELSRRGWWWPPPKWVSPPGPVIVPRPNQVQPVQESLALETPAAPAPPPVPPKDQG